MDHERSLKVREELARHLARRGDLTDAISVASELLQQQCRVAGSHSVAVGQTQRLLGSLWLAVGQVQRGREALNAAMKIFGERLD